VRTKIKVTVVTKTMQAARLTAPRRIRVLALPVPRPGSGEALVRIRAVGVCRSDLHYYLYGRIGDQVIRHWPQTLGHEPAGDVAAVGAGVRNVKTGDRVAVEPATPCGRCPDCRRGAGNVCKKIGFLGMPGQRGAFAEYLVHPARFLEKLPRSVSYDLGAALEPFAIGLHAVSLLGRLPARRALVVGAGPVGLSVLAALKLGRRQVTVCDYIPARLKVARRMGADRTVRVKPGISMAKVAETFKHGYDAVFEAGGTAEAVDLSLRAAGPGGFVALIGIPDGDTIPVNLHVARRKELTIRNVRRSNGELALGIRLVAGGKVDLGPMITHRGGLADAGKLLALVARRGDGVVKAVIRP
jgi:L-iditol 2-dehydrogenase